MADSPARIELRALVRLSVPVVTVQVGLMAMGVVDTIMVGHVTETALAGVALGAIYSFFVAGFGMGVLMAIDPLVAQALGAGDTPAAARAIQRGLFLALLLCLPVSIPLLAAGPVLRALQQPEPVVLIAAAFSRLSILSVPPLLAFVVLRVALQALHRTWVVVLAVVAANVVNLVLNWLLVFGHGGFPALGPIGSAWATVAARWVLAVGVLFAGWSSLGVLVRPFQAGVARLRPLVRTLRIGLPIGLQFMLEMGTFSAVAIFMGWLGARELASHQVAINLASLSFMVPMGISIAAAVRVGHAVGRQDMAGARLSAAVALACGAMVMVLSALAFVAAPRAIAGVYTNDAQVAALAATLIKIAAVFQVFDGLQVVAVGVLRGTGDTRTPMVVNVLGFVLIGLPLSLWLGFRSPLGAAGLWWGLVAGLAAVAAILLLRVRSRLRLDLSRLHVEDAAPGSAAALS